LFLGSHCLDGGCYTLTQVGVVSRVLVVFQRGDILRLWTRRLLE